MRGWNELPFPDATKLIQGKIQHFTITQFNISDNRITQHIPPTAKCTNALAGKRSLTLETSPLSPSYKKLFQNLCPSPGVNEKVPIQHFNIHLCVLNWTGRAGTLRKPLSSIESHIKVNFLYFTIVQLLLTELNSSVSSLMLHKA